MTRDQWVAKAERDLQGILFRGFTTKVENPSDLFRMMCTEARHLREKLCQIFDELAPKAVPIVANGTSSAITSQAEASKT